MGAPSIDWLGVPLKAGDRTIGVLVAQTYTPGVRYGEREKHILQFVSTQIAMAIERKRTEEQLLENERRYRLLFEADRKSTRLNSSHSQISYAVFCLKKKKKRYRLQTDTISKNTTHNEVANCAM